MSSPSIKSLVDRGIEIRKQLKLLSKELDTIEERLTDKAIYADQVPLVDPDREGKRYLAKGTDLIVPVIFTADKIIGTFRDGSPVHKIVLNGLGLNAICNIGHFFTLTPTWVNNFDDGKRFRSRAAELLGDRAPAFITACLSRDKHGIPRSSINIAWDSAQPNSPRRSPSPGGEGQGEGEPT